MKRLFFLLLLLAPLVYADPVVTLTTDHPKIGVLEAGGTTVLIFLAEAGSREGGHKAVEVVRTAQNAARQTLCDPLLSGVSISGIAVHSWPWNGIAMEGTPDGPGYAQHSISRVFIGTDYTGSVAKPNGASGIFTFGVPMTVSNSIIANNAHAGVAVARGTSQATVWFNAIHSNGGLPIDWGLAERTPDDAAESDGVPNAPRILDAFYDASAKQTIVRGTVRLHDHALGAPIARRSCRRRSAKE